MSFSDASAVTRVAPGRYRLEVDPAWFQGRGAFGGIVAAWLLRALVDVAAKPARSPRELSGSFCAPLKAGPAEIEARVLRAGMRVSFVQGELRQRGKVVATAGAVLAAPRAAGLSYAELPMPAAPAPERVPLWTLPGGLPAYADFFELRQCLGADPAGGATGDVADTGGWVRLRRPEPVDAPLAAALLDCFPPAFFTRLAEPCAAGTVAWNVHFLCELPRAETPPAAYHLLRARSRVATGGYSSEDDELWAPDGTLVARARQLVAAV